MRWPVPTRPRTPRCSRSSVTSAPTPEDTASTIPTARCVKHWKPAVTSTAREWNYRRRSMGPYCRFQGSWLVGLRYVRFDNRLVYSARGENDNTVNADLPRFFSSNDKIKNNLFGPQAGFDLLVERDPRSESGHWA